MKPPSALAVLLSSPLLGSASACAPRPATDDAPADDTDAQDVPPLTDGSPLPLSEAALADIGDALEAFAWWIPRLSIDPVRTAADRSDAVQQPPCPFVFILDDGTRFWEDNCTTADGNHFFGGLARQRGGMMTLRDDEDLSALADAWGPALLADYVPGSAAAAAQPGERINGLCRVDRASGGYVSVDGDFLRLDLQVAAVGAVMRATLRTFGGPVIDTFATDDVANWVHQGIAPELAVREVAGATPEQMVRWVHGALSPIEGPYSTVHANAVAVTGPAIAGCALEPSGTLSARDQDGVWYDVTFDAPVPDPAGPSPGDACDGCGTVSLLGAEVGRVCPDLSALWWMPGTTAEAP